MLKIEDIHVSYGKVKVLFGVDLEAKPGEILCLLGRNGAGKTTAMKAIMGLLPLSQGKILLDGREISTLPAHEVPKQRIGYVPQGRRLFAELSVAENIEMGLMACGSGAETREWVLELFPRLRERLAQQASTLSGGEQQMLATARALCLKPKVLLLDEPTEGLQPSMIELIRNVIVQMKREGLAVVLVEQRVDAVLSVADQVAFIEHGRSVETLAADELKEDPDKIHKYLGV
ncbi:ABC-type branched-chain amino acid transport system, ATPase component [Hoeflea phototrophica DFL-43]|uniref:ABC-type branched-chain amino acid transport system, ATPase component n=1 Tax=Hoeflea phototrophica (strain DSM 17068 / NCIMB 14078 / DFL-43) TaxID=411684 RepID=A9D0X9_HOEPD|nr:ABC transporter ATP-binding protein [Hoeflea phototrophica]EDQ35086.1 ABC-type branched-chain amino acid transport system, ATPase component [Hoeflea phototrophica DFL-43]